MRTLLQRVGVVFHRYWDQRLVVACFRASYVQTPWCGGGNFHTWCTKKQPRPSTTHAAAILFDVLRVRCACVYMCVQPQCHVSFSIRALRTCMDCPSCTAT